MDKYIYRAKLDRVVDGDTIDAMIDVGFGEIFIQDAEGKQYNINEQLKTEGHAYEYHGGKKQIFKG